MPAAAPVHDGPHEQIAEVTGQIEQDPDNAALYLTRAELHRLHGDHDAAVADLHRARQRDAAVKGLDLAWSRLLVDLNHLPMAIRFVDRHLEQHGEDGEAQLLRAELLKARGADRAAAAAYTRAIALLEPPQPDHYLARSERLLALGRDHVEQALQGLDEGIARLGPLVVLQLRAIDLELTLVRPDAALRRLDTILAASKRQERWLAQRGDILWRAGRDVEALRAYQEALAAIATLRPRHRTTTAVVQLEAHVRARLRQLEPERAAAARSGEP